MPDPLLLNVGIAGVDDVIQQADAMGDALGKGFSAPSADVDNLNASIAALAATITQLGATAAASATQVQGIGAAGDSLKDLIDAMSEFKANIVASTDEIENLGESLEKFGGEAQQAGQRIHQMGEAGGAAAASFRLLQTAAGGAVEVLTGGGLSSSISLVKELGEGVEATAKHFGTIGEEIAQVSTRFVATTAVLGTLVVGMKEMADHSKEDTLEIHALAQALGTSEAQVLQLKGAFADAGVGADQLAMFIRAAAVSMQDAWADIQRSVRDATMPIIQDQLAIQAAVRATEEAMIGVREAAIDTAQAQMQASEAQGTADRSAAEAKISANESILDAQEKELDASYKQADADRALAEAQIDASEAVIHQKEAELDAQNKLIDAQRAYADAVVNANEAQLNLQDEQKNFQYSGDDAYRKLADAIDAVTDAERKAADEANAVYEAVNSVAEAATGVKSAYVSLYAAQLAYREAHGEGRITRQERQELRREQTEVGLESAQERVKSAQFQYEKTARDAIPEAEEAQGKAKRGVGAAKEAEDKAEQQYAESAQRAADKLEKAGSAAAAALEKVAKAALDVATANERAENERKRAGLAVDRADENVDRKRLAADQASQRAADERARAQLQVENALANVRKTEFDSTFATVRSEDALEIARLKQRAATDQITASEAALTAARSKEVDDRNSNINAILQDLRTGKGPAGFNIEQTPPGEIARAAEFQAGGPGHLTEELTNLQKAFRAAIIPMTEFEGVMTALRVPRAVLTAARFRQQFEPGSTGPLLIQPPSPEQQARGALEHERFEPAERLEVAERKAASALNNLADDIGAKFIPKVTQAAEKIAQSPKEAAAAGLGLAAGATAAGTAIGQLASALGQSIAKALTGGGEAVALKVAAASHEAAAAKLVGAAEALTVSAEELKAGAVAEKEGAAAEEAAAAKEEEAAVAETTAAKAEGEAAVAETTAARAEMSAAAAEAAAAEKIAASGGGGGGGGLGGLGSALGNVGKLSAFIAVMQDAFDKIDKGPEAEYQKQVKAGTNVALGGPFAPGGIFGGPAPPPPPPPSVPVTQQTPFEKTTAKDRLTGADEVGERPLPPAGQAYSGEEGDLPPAPPPKQPVHHQAQSPSAVAVPPQETAAKTEELNQKLSDLSQKNDQLTRTNEELTEKSNTVSDRMSDLTSALTQSKEHAAEGDDKIAAAADRLSHSADAVAQGSVGGGGAPAPGERSVEEAKDAIDQIKESIDKLVSGKGLIQPPKEGTRERAAYDDEVRHLLESISEVNHAQAGLIAEQARATAENEKLTQEQERLTAAQTDKVKTEASDEQQLTSAQVNKLEQETSDEHETAQAQEELIRAQADLVRAQAQAVENAEHHAAGGIINAPGISGDNVPINATSGEFIVNAADTAKNRPLLESINAGKTPHFAAGGVIGSSPQSPPQDNTQSEMLVASMTALTDKQTHLVARQEQVTTKTEKLVEDQTKLVHTQTVQVGGSPGENAPAARPHVAHAEELRPGDREQESSELKQHGGERGLSGPPPLFRYDIQGVTHGSVKGNFPAYDADGKPIMGGSDEVPTPVPPETPKGLVGPPPFPPPPWRVNEPATPEMVAKKAAELAGKWGPSAPGVLLEREPTEEDLAKQRETAEFNKHPHPAPPRPHGHFLNAEMDERNEAWRKQYFASYGETGDKSGGAPNTTNVTFEKIAAAATRVDDVTKNFSSEELGMFAYGAAAAEQKAAAAATKDAAAALTAAADKPAPQPAAHASGGMINGTGGPTEDNIPIMASAGEFVVNAKSTAQHRGLLEKINSGKGFADGGAVDDAIINRGAAPEEAMVPPYSPHAMYELRKMRREEKAQRREDDRTFIFNPAYNRLPTSKNIEDRRDKETILYEDEPKAAYALGGFVGGMNPGLAHEPSVGALQAGLTSNIGMGPGFMAAKMQTQSTQSYAVDLRTDHGTYTVLATDDQMGSMLQGSIAQKIASTGTKPSWWS